MLHLLVVSVAVAVAVECTPWSLAPVRPSFLLAVGTVVFVARELDDVVVSFRPFFVPSVVD